MWGTGIRLQSENLLVALPGPFRASVGDPAPCQQIHVYEGCCYMGVVLKVLVK